MAKLTNGYEYMEAVKLIRKIDDIPELKNELIAASEGKTHLQMSNYSLLLAEHILELSKVGRSDAINECFVINQKWQSGEAKFQDARQVAFKINRLAREEQDKLKEKVFRAMGQVAATPHVKWHALVASEYAVTIINLMYPKDFEKVEEERKLQIQMMGSV